MADKNDKFSESSSTSKFEPTSKKVRTESLLMWEEEEFEALDSFGSELSILPDTAVDLEDCLLIETKNLLEKFNSTTQDWYYSSKHHKKATLLVGLYLETGIHWDHRSDLIATRVLATLFDENLRAHKEGIFTYSNGAWLRIKEIPESVMQGLEKMFNIAQIQCSTIAFLLSKKPLSPLPVAGKEEQSISENLDFVY